MSDSKRRYQAIREGLNRVYPAKPQGVVSRHLNVLAAMISGIIGARSTNLPAIASLSSLEAVVESRVRRLTRWIKDKVVTKEVYFMPFAKALIDALAPNGLTLVIDGSCVGRGCVALMIGIVYKQRALPVAWIVVKGAKGHFAEAMHLELIKEVQALIPEGCKVTLLGDGEFDGVDLQSLVRGWQWSYVLRTSKTISLFRDGEKFCFEQTEQVIRKGDIIDFDQLYFTEKQFGPLTGIIWWGMEFKEPLYLITNMDSTGEAIGAYKRRFLIETFFSDQKSRGFHLNKSHISDPQRLSRLIIAASLAYYWIVYLGQTALQNGWLRFIHRKNRCDLSLFQLGLRLIDYLIDHALPIPVNLEWKGRI